MEYVNLTAEMIRGHNDSIILSVLNIKDSYGYQINKDIESKSDGLLVLTEATLYTTLKRLARLGYIVSYWGEGINNIQRKYYSITKTGKEYLEQERINWTKTNYVLSKFLGGTNGKQD